MPCFRCGTLDHSQDVSLTAKGSSQSKWREERYSKETEKIICDFVGVFLDNFCDGRSASRRSLNQEQKKVANRGSLKHVEMLLGKAVTFKIRANTPNLWESNWGLIFFLLCLHLPKCMRALCCQCVFYNNDFTSQLKGRLGLLPTICPHSVPLHPKWVPGLFVFIIDPFWWSQVWSSDQYKPAVPRCVKSF